MLSLEEFFFMTMILLVYHSKDTSYFLIILLLICLLLYFSLSLSLYYFKTGYIIHVSQIDKLHSAQSENKFYIDIDSVLKYITSVLT